MEHAAGEQQVAGQLEADCCCSMDRAEVYAYSSSPCWDRVSFPMTQQVFPGRWFAFLGRVGKTALWDFPCAPGQPSTQLFYLNSQHFTYFGRVSIFRPWRVIYEYHDKNCSSNSLHQPQGFRGDLTKNLTFKLLVKQRTPIVCSSPENLWIISNGIFPERGFSKIPFKGVGFQCIKGWGTLPMCYSAQRVPRMRVLCSLSLKEQAMGWKGLSTRSYFSSRFFFPRENKTLQWVVYRTGFQWWRLKDKL